MHFSFRATLLTFMLAVLLSVALLLGGAAFFYARFAAEDLAEQILEQAAQRVEQHIQQVLDVAEAETSTLSSLMTDGWMRPDNHERTTDYFIAALEARPSLSYLSLGMPSGKYYHAFRNRDGQLSALWLVPEQGVNDQRSLFEFSVEPDGTKTTLNDIPRSSRTPPFLRPYYQATEAAGEPIWTGTYVFLGSGDST